MSIAEILTKDSEADTPGIPFCDFADIGKIKMQEVLFKEVLKQIKN